MTKREFFTRILIYLQGKKREIIHHNPATVLTTSPEPTSAGRRRPSPPLLSSLVSPAFFSPSKNAPSAKDQPRHPSKSAIPRSISYDLKTLLYALCRWWRTKLILMTNWPAAQTSLSFHPNDLRSKVKSTDDYSLLLSCTMLMICGVFLIRSSSAQLSAFTIVSWLSVPHSIEDRGLNTNYYPLFHYSLPLKN